MFHCKMNLSFEGSPLEILRRYAPWLIGAGCAVGVVASLYYTSFKSNVDIIENTQTTTTDVITDSKDTIDAIFTRIT